MARGRKTGGRQKGARNRATEEARAAAAASGIVPLDYMLAVMRDPAADHKRRDAMAMAAAPYLHPRLTAIDAKLSPAAVAVAPETTGPVCLAHPGSCPRRSGVGLLATPLRSAPESHRRCW
jgi:hypothetical protein